jgi:hypothetical protein
MVPFGLTNAPTTFMCLMNGIFRNYLDRFVIVFLNDILIYSKSKGEHEKHSRLILQVLREQQLYAKLRKSSFNQRQIHYLEHIISEEGIAIYPKKIEAISGWPTLKNIVEVRSFMELVGYYKRFIGRFSKIVHPITCLQKKKIKLNGHQNVKKASNH